MMNREILLATNNTHKLKEIEELFKGYEVKLPVDLGIEYSFHEGGVTYLENALGKARHLYGLLEQEGLAGRFVVLADDSGLSVDALGGEPGIRSARFGGREIDGKIEKLTDAERNIYLLECLKGISDRSAHFICCMVLVVEHERFYIVQEKLDGYIAMEPRGKEGFGYDPLFYIPERGKMLAELSMAEKNRISHRGRAAALMLELIKELDR